MLFAQDMLDHEFPGCPPNSRCTPDLGKKYLSFLEILKHPTPLGKKKGPEQITIPIKGWWQQGPKEQEVIWWQSECPLYRQKQIRIAEVLVKNSLSQLPPGFILGKLWLLNHQGKVKVYPLPRRESPIALYQEQLIILANFDRHYFQLAIKENGNLAFPLEDLYRPSRNIACPEVLVKTYQQEDSQFLSLFPRYYCEEIWDHTNKQAVVILLNHECR